MSFMPQAIPLGLKEKVKMLALQVGIREAARQCELPESTVKSWCTREGWMDQKQEIEQITDRVVEQKGLRPLASITPSELVLRVGTKSKLILAKAVNKTAKGLNRLKPEELVHKTVALKNTTGAWKDLHGASEAPQGSLVNINILNQECPEV